MWALNTFYATQWAMYETSQLSGGVAPPPTYEEICQFLTSLDRNMVLVNAKTGVQSAVQVVAVVPEQPGQKTNQGEQKRGGRG